MRGKIKSREPGSKNIRVCPLNPLNSCYSNKCHASVSEWRNGPGAGEGEKTRSLLSTEKFLCRYRRAIGPSQINSHFLSLSLSCALSLSLLDLGETEGKRMSPDSTHVMLVTRRPILTSVEENGTFVPSKTRIGSGRIVPRIDESRAIRFCLPPAFGTTSRVIREIDRLSNACARLYPFTCLVCLLPLLLLLLLLLLFLLLLLIPQATPPLSDFTSFWLFALVTAQMAIFPLSVSLSLYLLSIFLQPRPDSSNIYSAR